jgi:O-antigen/teichoic acid export membrane protein
MPVALLNEKNRNRIFVILLHAFSQFLPSIANLVLSVLVVRLFAPQWWGEIAALQLYQYLAVQVVAWGNKDVLLKSFSRDPGKLSVEFINSFANRLWLLLPVIAIACLFQDNAVAGIHLAIWIACRFVQQSVDAPSLFLRKFNAVILSEIGSLIIVAGALYTYQGVSFSNILLIVSLGQIIKTLFQLIAFYSLFKGMSLVKVDWSFFRTSFPFMLLGLLGILQQKTDMIFVIRFTNDLDIARYQVFTTFYLLALSIPMLIAGPFVKNVYRVSSSAMGNIQFVYAIAGVFLNLVIFTGSYLLLEYLYHFHFDIEMYVLAWLSASLTYLFSLKIIRFYKSDKQMLVLRISLGSVLVNAVISIMLLPVLGITGALIANVSSQVFLLLCFRIASSRC